MEQRVVTTNQLAGGDHLGTPRIIVDQTGALANVKRHDYLPFGEELTTQGLRSTLPSYSGDNVRQKFTSKERDIETGLDYFLARYYSSNQGRFTSPDEFKGGPDELFVLATGDEEKQALPYAEITNPQSLNKYTYVYNNPLRFIDADGHQGQVGLVTHLLRWFAQKLDPQTEVEKPRRHPLASNPDRLAEQAVQEFGSRGLATAETLESFGLDFGTTDLARQMAKKDNLRSGVAATMIAVNVLTLGRGSGRIVLGETMSTRVIPVAEKLGAITYKNRGAATLEKNVRWLESQIRNGKKVFDVGLDGARDARNKSPFYAKDLETLIKRGFKRVYFGTVKIKNETYKVYEWVRQ